jgi:hypothetical protein
MKNTVNKTITQYTIFYTANVPYLKDGGMYSGGRTGGSGWPDIATSIRCIARINSSAVSFPS